MSALFTEEARSQNHGWPVYVFIGLIMALWLGFAGYCFARALTSRPRLVADDEGFSYDGFFKTSQFLWTDIVSFRWVHDRGNFEWLEVIVKQTRKRPRRVKLDFSGIKPGRMEFVAQLYESAPQATRVQ